MSLKYLMFKNWGTLRELPAIINCMIEKKSGVRVMGQTEVLRGQTSQNMYLYVCIIQCTVQK